MLSHVHVGINELARSFPFYAAIAEELGLALRFHEPERGWACWARPGAGRPLLVIGRPYDGADAHPGNGQMVGLLAPDRPSVDRCHARALTMGGRDDGRPGPRPQYHRHYYGAYLRDPDGNKLCICCHDPDPDQPNAEDGSIRLGKKVAAARPV